MTLLSQDRSAWVVLGLVAVLGLSACQKADDSPSAGAPPVAAPTTPGEKLDNAIANTQQAAQKARIAATESTAQARAEASVVGSRAADAVKEAGTEAKSALSAAGAALGNAVDDASITASVSAHLAKDPELSALRIDVDTQRGAVTLSGPAPTEAAKARAEQIARAVHGVTGVSNKLEIRPS